MTEYKENIWYGWNGGECPVHPETVVEVVTDQGLNPVQAHARGWIWDSMCSPIRAFRVVREYKEPREFWITSNHYEFAKVWDENPSGKEVFSECIHVREVIDNG